MGFRELVKPVEQRSGALTCGFGTSQAATSSASVDDLTHATNDARNSAAPASFGSNVGGKAWGFDRRNRQIPSVTRMAVFVNGCAGRRPLRRKTVSRRATNVRSRVTHSRSSDEFAPPDGQSYSKLLSAGSLRVALTAFEEGHVPGVVGSRRRLRDATLTPNLICENMPDLGDGCFRVQRRTHRSAFGFHRPVAAPSRIGSR